MLKKVFLSVALLFSGFFLSGCSLKTQPAALQINTTPSANVFIDGKLVGKTPFSSDDFKTSEVVIKLIPESTEATLASWEGRVKLTGGILTLIDREFSTSEANSSGQTLSLEKIKDKNSAPISLITEPDGALVKIDGETKGFSPLSAEGIAVGDHEISFSKDGYLEKSFRAKNVLGYKLIVTVKLAQESSGEEPTESLTPAPTDSKLSPVPTGSGTSANPEKPYVLILETETGFLRVRSAPSGSELTQIKPGEKYQYLDANTDKSWYKILYEKDKEGWISAKYAELTE